LYYRFTIPIPGLMAVRYKRIKDYVFCQRFCSSAFFIIQHLPFSFYRQWSCLASHHFAAVQVAVWFLYWLLHPARAAYLLFPVPAFLAP
jgi:hypothetical protein